MRRCPRCQATFAAPARYCERDGSPLIEVADPPPRRTDVAPAHAAPKPVAAGSLAGVVVDGRYRVLRRVGEGGMSYVYGAQEVATGREVALKILTPRLAADQVSMDRLRREAALAMRFDHPNVCPILAHGRTETGLIYLVMPYLRGEPLHETETRRGPFPLQEGVALLVQLCAGLQHAHDLGVVHRDLKPENVMLVPDPARNDGIRAVVMDFGLGKALEPGPELARLTQTGIVLGTPEFMSPEQVRGRPVDARSDIFALGVLAFELFSGRLPFEGRTAQEAMIARLRGTAQPLREVRPDLPARLETALARALASDPAERFPSMRDFAQALEHALGTGVFARLFGR